MMSHPSKPSNYLLGLAFRPASGPFLPKSTSFSFACFSSQWLCANWFRTPRVKELSAVSRYDMNLPLSALSSSVAVGLFDSWFANASLLDPVYDLLVGTYGGQSERTKFRALA